MQKLTNKQIAKLMSSIYFGMPLESAAIECCMNPIELYNNLTTKGFLRFAVNYALAKARSDIYSSLQRYAMTPSDKQFMALKFIMMSRFKAVEDPATNNLSEERTRINAAMAASKLADKLATMDPESVKNVLQLYKKKK